MLTIRHFKIFKIVAECKSMSKAAEQLYISQPTISQTISDIEKHYKVKLFDRYPKQLFITSAGEKLLNNVNSLLYKFETVENLNLSNDWRIDVRIGATDTAASCILTHIINKSKEVNDKLEFYVSIDNTDNIEQKLLKNEIDFAIIEGSIKSKDIVTMPIADDCLVLVCGKNHPLADTPNIKANDLCNQDFIVREKGSGTRQLFDDVMKLKHINHNIKWECSSFAAIKQAVINNQGIGLISARLIADEVENGSLKVIMANEFVWKRDFYLCYHKSKNLSKDLMPIVETAVSYKLEGVKCPIFDDGCNK